MTVAADPSSKRRKLDVKDLHIPLNKQTVHKHPLNVKPSGNQILASQDQLDQLAKSAGNFKHLSDELIFQVLSYLDPLSLLSFSHVSKFTYAFATHEEVWRSMYTGKSSSERKEQGLEFEKWTGSWRSSVLHFPQTIYDIDCGFVYSDLIFIPYGNSQIDYQEVFGPFIEEQKYIVKLHGYLNAEKYPTPNDYPLKSRIPRLDESTLSYHQFETEWSNHPFIVGSNTSCPLQRWSPWTISWLNAKFPNVKFRQESVQWPLSLYNEYSKTNMDESPLYLFDCRSKAFEELIPDNKGYYPNPPCFAPQSNDMLTVFEESRPDHTWIITGPERSGSTWHKDPNSTDAWNVVLEGSKLWVMFPPDVKPPGVFTDNDEGEVMSPIGVAEWVKSGFWNDSLKLIEGTNCGGLIGITFPGECIYVPSGWWHTVINLEDGVALTGNFIPSCKLGKVLKFMKDKTYQVSGFRHDKLQRFMKNFLLEHPIQNEDGQDAQISQRREKIEKYLQRVELANNDEDVGVLDGTECMPVFECFIELLKAKGFEDELAKGLEQMHQLDKEERKGQVKKSETWEKLTKKDDRAQAFSFGFEEESSDDE